MTLYTGGSDGFVSSTAAPIASGWSEPSSRAGLSPAVDQRLFTAHVHWRFSINLEESLPQAPMPTFGIRFARGMRFRNFGISLEFVLIKILLSFRGAAVYRLLSLAIYASIPVTTASSDPTLLRQSTGNPFIVASDPIVACVRVTDRDGSLQ